MRILGVIIAGGRSLRMGGIEKSLMELAGRPLIAHIIEVLRHQTDDVVINANGDSARFAGLGREIIADGPDLTGTPMVGLNAALTYGAAHGFGAVVTTPSDTPFLPPDLVAKLKGDGAAIARSGGQDHYLTGFWPVSLSTFLEDAHTKGTLKRMQDWMSLAGARSVEWSTTPHDPFFNINTPEDLAQAKLWIKRDA
jgi:molybdopterin-guanine dinucleotide biosynthesis protein A